MNPRRLLLEKTGHNAEAVEFLEQLVKSAPWEPSYRLRLAKAQLASAKDPSVARVSLASIASGAQSSYDLRVQAAVSLVGQPHSDLGSAELNLLSSPPGAVTATSADKFYFYEARIMAAQNISDPHLRLQLLTHCIADFPHREEARLPLFRAAAATQSNEFAITVLQPLLQRQFLRNVSSSDNLQDIIDTGENAEYGQDSDVNTRAISTTKLTRAQQAETAQQVAEVMMRLGRLSEAISYYDLARRLESSPAARAALVRKIADAKTMLRVQRENAARQPIFHEALEQDRVVRPHLVARVTPSSAVSGTKGSVKQ